MGRLRDAWNDGSDASRGAAEAAGGHTAAVLYAFIKMLGMIVDGVLIFLRSTILGTLSKVPKIGPQMADGLIVAGHKMKMGKSDVICNVIYGDGVVIPRKAQWESEKTAFVTDNGETFYAKGVGYSPKRLNGKVPTVWALRSSSEITEPLEAAITTARMVGRFQQFTRADGNPDVAVDIDPNTMDHGPGVGRPREQAMTDGGATAGARRPEPPAMSGGRETAYDGLVLSFRDAYEQFGSKVDQEEMQQQETRGKLAALNMKDMASNWKYILAILAAFALGLLGPSLAGQIAGSGGEAVSGGISSFGLWITPNLSAVLAGVPF